MPQVKKPSRLKMLEGNRSKVGKAMIFVDPPGKGHPQMPPDLSDLEQEMWVDIVASLPDGLLSRADNAILERFVTAWARFRAARILIRETGLLVTTQLGLVRNPVLVIEQAARKEMHASGGELGLSPVARARLASVDRWDDDPMEQLLDGEDDGAWNSRHAAH